MKILRAFLPLALVSSVLCAQSTDSTDSQLLGPGEIAIVNGERIPESLFRLYALNATQTNPDLLSDKERDQLVDQLILLRLFADEAERIGLNKERRIAAELELQRIQLLAQHMSNRFADENPPTSTQLREIYDANLELLSGTRYKTRHIVVDTEDAAAKLIDQLDDGDDFAELAQKNSNDPTADSGGDLGWITAASVPESFAAALEATTPGEYFPTPVQTQYGWHVILVEETEDSGPPELEDVRDDLDTVAKSQNLAEYAQQLRDAAEVEIVP